MHGRFFLLADVVAVFLQIKVDPDNVNILEISLVSDDGLNKKSE